MYRLDNSFARGYFTATVVGCGGTGGFLAESLFRLLPPHSRLALVDHDRVEERNLSRQVFSREDLGQFKSEVLAKRLTRRYGRPIAYSTSPIAVTQISYPGLVIGCVDNGPARRDIARRLSERSSLTWVGGYSMAVPRELQRGPQMQTQLWWIDAGNGENYGQILIGNAEGAAFDPEGLCRALPLPTIQRPELLAQVPSFPGRAPPRQGGCVEIAEQGPTINQSMATLVVEVVRRIIEGTCSWMQLYLDMQAGTLHPVLATPEAVELILGKKGKLTRPTEI
jgi:hypothetical protein